MGESLGGGIFRNLVFFPELESSKLINHLIGMLSRCSSFLHFGRNVKPGLSS